MELMKSFYQILTPNFLEKTHKMTNIVAAATS